MIGFISSSEGVNTGSSGFLSGSSASVLMMATILDTGWMMMISVLAVIMTDPMHMSMQVNTVMPKADTAYCYDLSLVLKRA